MIAPETLDILSKEPGEVLHCSTKIPWRSVLFRIIQSPPEVLTYETPATPDQSFVAVLKGTSRIECKNLGRWKHIDHRVGTGGSTPPFFCNRLRWRQTSVEPLITAHLFLPSTLFGSALEDLAFRQSVFPNTFGYLDPVVRNVMLSMATAVEMKESELYAESAALFTVAHLLLSRKSDEYKSSSFLQLTDRRLADTLHYINASLSDQLTIEELARQAGVSSFHFARLFKKHMGMTPYRYITKKRMERAASQLSDTEFPVELIAFHCGYRHLGHFASTFRRCMGLTPSAFRTKARGLSSVRR